MLIALLALLGVDLIVIVFLVGAVIARRLWVSRQPGIFKGAIRTTTGEVGGVSAKWRRGQGRWVNDVLIWTKAPFLFRNVFVATLGAGAKRTAAEADEIKRMGDDPIILTIQCDGAAVEVATRGEHQDLLLGPYLERSSPAHT